MNISAHMLSLTRPVGGADRISPDNIFVIETVSYGRVLDTRPNWALIIPLALILLAAIVVACIFLYHNWRKNNCYPIYCAGKVTYIRKGQILDKELGFSGYGSWLDETVDFVIKRRAQEEGRIYDGLRIEGLYLDAAFTTPLDLKAKLTGPLYIFPKLK